MVVDYWLCCSVDLSMDAQLAERARGFGGLGPGCLQEHSVESGPSAIERIAVMRNRPA